MKNKLVLFFVCAMLLFSSIAILANANTIKISNDNNPPNPPVIEGPTSGKIKETYAYNFTITDPDDDYLTRLLIDWGDGTTTDKCWTCGGSPQKNGTKYGVGHTWSKTGNYLIKAKVWDTQNFESDWSEPLAVSMSKTRTDFKSLIQKIFMFLPNIYKIK